MNEQLIVKNFGPIKDATVDFKRVTVFIGPTGGGKSTLAKLAAIFRSDEFYDEPNKEFASASSFKNFAISNFFSHSTYLNFVSESVSLNYKEGERNIHLSEEKTKEAKSFFTEILSLLKNIKVEIEDDPSKTSSIELEEAKVQRELIRQRLESDRFSKYATSLKVSYAPAERVFIPSISDSLAGLMRDDIGLPKTLLDFTNNFSLARRTIPSLKITFLGVDYIRNEDRDFIQIPNSKELFRLYETASGIQSVTPLLVLLEHLSRNTEQAQSFILEEPELNLFPLAQFELVKTLVEKCAQLDSNNDLVLTTHSPYVLTALNLLCYAYRIAQQNEATAKRVAKLIPRHCWIDPDQFAAYYVDRPDTKRKQQVRSIINKKTGLIEENELDTASDELGSIFDKLVKLRKPTATPARTK